MSILLSCETTSAIEVRCNMNQAPLIVRFFNLKSKHFMQVCSNILDTLEDH